MLVSKKIILSASKLGLANPPVWQNQTPQGMSSENYGIRPKLCSVRTSVSSVSDPRIH